MSELVQPTNKKQQQPLSNWKPARLGLEDTCSCFGPLPFQPSWKQQQAGRSGTTTPSGRMALWQFLQLPTTKPGGRMGWRSQAHWQSLVVAVLHVTHPKQARVMLVHVQYSQHLSSSPFKSQELEDKFGPEGSANPKRLRRSLSHAHHHQTLPPGVNYFEIESSWRAPAHKYPQIHPHPVCIITGVLWWERTWINDWLTMPYFSNFMQFGSFPCIWH